jgi:RHS repeat-associated protein
MTGAGGDNQLRFTAREDDGTALYYYRARYYHPTLQRFISEDPIGFLGRDVNLYAYVGSDPLSFVDPYGLDWIWSQSRGQLSYLDNHTGITIPIEKGKGYSGAPGAVNDSAREHEKNIGPIPKGTYDIGPIDTVVSNQTGKEFPRAMRITRRGRDPYGRDGFIIHDGDMKNRTSSKGCIILPDEVREAIGASGDKVLRVVP